MTEEYQLHHGDCLEVLKTLPDASIDAIVTDPPYGLSFMGKRWDYDVPSEEVWRECLRVAKPGAHLLAFAGARTQHRMCVRIEDAGFEIRDMIAWVYGSGFPKSLDVSKAIDKAAGVEREVTGTAYRHEGRAFAEGASGFAKGEVLLRDKAASAASASWQGWGTALKPAMEPITVARKPLIGTVAANVLQHGTGAINVDGCRVGMEGERPKGSGNRLGVGNAYQMKDYVSTNGGNETSPLGRWPANLIHDGSDEATALLSDAARFFYCAKASKKDRNEGCEELDRKISARSCQAQAEAKRCNIVECEGGAFNKARLAHNHHPTVKPTDLMRYLCRLVSKPGGIVLDPFAGSGSTGAAAILEDFRFIGIEREAEYVAIAKARIEAAIKERSRFLF